MDPADNTYEPCGIKLVRLINAQSFDIACREASNSNKMCLYRTGSYWHGFEHSAFFLTRLFPKAETFVVHHPDLPTGIVGSSISAKIFQRYQQQYRAVCSETDYIEYEVKPLMPSEYGEWHTQHVKRLS